MIRRRFPARQRLPITAGLIALVTMLAFVLSRAKRIDAGHADATLYLPDKRRIGGLYTERGFLDDPFYEDRGLRSGDTTWKSRGYWTLAGSKGASDRGLPLAGGRAGPRSDTARRDMACSSSDNTRAFFLAKKEPISSRVPLRQFRYDARHDIQKWFERPRSAPATAD